MKKLYDTNSTTRYYVHDGAFDDGGKKSAAAMLVAFSWCSSAFVF